MNRSVRDLRELICVSRLTFRDSDDEDNLELNANEQYDKSEAASLSRDFNSESSRGSSAGSSSLQASPPPASDSGVVTSTDSNSDSVNATDNLSIGLANDKTKSVTPAKKQQHKKTKKPETKGALQPRPPPPRAAATAAARYDIRSKLTPLPPVSAKTHANSSHSRQQHVQPENELSLINKMLESADMEVVSDWLRQANMAVTEISIWSTSADNFVRFSHFWLAMFSTDDQQAIFNLEYNLLHDQLTFVFDSSKCKFAREDLTRFLTLVLREYPDKLLSAKGSHLFLQYLETLCERREAFRTLLSNVKYSTTVKEHIQCILAIRSYAIISIWEAVIKFFRNLSASPDFPLPSSASKSFADARNADSLLALRVEQAISLGFTDVLRYYMDTGQVTADFKSSHQRSLVFMAVVHSQPAVLAFLLSYPKIAATVNVPSDSGNAPLHAAANAGDAVLISTLLSASNINVNVVNRQCDNATPLHIAVMHGHAEVVKQLLTARADVSARMGQMTAEEMADAFEQLDIADILRHGR